MVIIVEKSLGQVLGVLSNETHIDKPLFEAARHAGLTFLLIIFPSKGKIISGIGMLKKLTNARNAKASSVKET